MPRTDARPRWLRGHEGGALREAEHEHEVEEQLEWLDRLTIAELQAAPPRGLALGNLQRGHGGGLPAHAMVGRLEDSIWVMGR